MRPTEPVSAGATKTAGVLQAVRLFFNRPERFQYQLELTGATGAVFQVLAHAFEHSFERLAVEDALGVLVQFIQAFRTGELDFARLTEHCEQMVHLF